MGNAACAQVQALQQAKTQPNLRQVVRAMDIEKTRGIGVWFCMAYKGFNAERQGLRGAA
jgi:hypothetical protein